MAVVVPGVAPGQIARLQLRAWDNRGGTLTSWQAATGNPAVDFGASPSFDLTTQSTAEGAILTGLRSFSICHGRLSSPVPAGNGVFSIQLTGNPGQAYVIETATNLMTWLPLQPFTNVSGMDSFTVTNAPPLRARFYRARLTP